MHEPRGQRGELVEKPVVLRRQRGQAAKDRPWLCDVSLDVLLRPLHPHSRVRPVVAHEGNQSRGAGQSRIARQPAMHVGQPRAHLTPHREIADFGQRHAADALEEEPVVAAPPIDDTAVEAGRPGGERGENPLVGRDLAKRVVDEPRKGLVIARDRGRRVSTGDVLVYVDADCRAPRNWLELVAREFDGPHLPVAVTGPYRFYDWDVAGRTLIWLYDWIVAPPTHVLVHHVMHAGAILYGGNFAVRAAALAQIGGFDKRIEFHGEDTNLGRRLTPVGGVAMCRDCWVWTSARRYVAMGKRKVFGLYVRNFWSEILRHQPADREHLDVRA